MECDLVIKKELRPVTRYNMDGLWTLCLVKEATKDHRLYDFIYRKYLD